MSASNPPLKMFTTVMLDGARHIRYSNRAKFRLGTLDKVLDFPTQGKSKTQRKALAATAQWLWACLYEPADVERFPTPEDVSEFVGDDNLMELIQTLVQCINLASPAEPDSKKADSSTQSPSPASS